ncbi:chemotaxis protein CheB [Modicisalibacter luteus]|uniref:Chemotaxis protein CheB n=1 Tax=Modicisalibacter luteus TaxID=453962 RepID=A0ABV7M0N1_9GAMM|nr:hypothetical protein GCM10007159_18430 [Halomonas lutea]
MADLLQPFSKLPVQQVTGTVTLLANHVYVIPPGRNLSTIDTHLRLSELEEKQHEQPGFGIISIRERLRLLGGSMEIDSAPGDGTSILVKVPARKA